MMKVTIIYEGIKSDDTVGNIVDTVKISNSITKMSEIVEYIKKSYFGGLNIDFSILSVST